MSQRRLKKGEKLVVASHNPGKVQEINDLLAPYGLSAVSAGDLGLAEPEENGASFVANAIIKAKAAALASGLPALADDSGLEVAALGGEPGIYSARWGGPNKDFHAAMQRVHDELQARGALSPEQRRANFNCALALAWPDGHAERFEGKVFGHLVWPPRGALGFGYDPFFVADGENITFGEMDPARKHAMSHRAQAFKQLLAACLEPAQVE